MKKNILHIALIALAFGLTACVSDKEFLEEDPKSTLTLENAYSTSDQVVATLLSAYELYEDFYFAGLGSDPFDYKQAGTDIMDGKYISTHYSNFTTSWSSTSAFVKTVWDDYYKIISYCNLAIRQADNVNWSSDSDKNRVLGEAKFLKGFAHMRLAELWGDVPIVDEFSEVSRFDYVRDPRAEVYQYAISQMEEAYSMLPSRSETTSYGRASKGAASLYLAEAYLALGVESGISSNYDSAVKWAQTTIAMHPLMTERFGVRAPGATGSRNGIDNALAEGSAFSDLFVSENMTTSSNTEAIWIAASAPDYATYAASGSEGHYTITIDLTPALQDMSFSASLDEGVGKPWSENIPTSIGMYAYDLGGCGWCQSPITWFASYQLWDEQHNFGTSDDRYKEGVTVRTKYRVINEKHSMFGQYIGYDGISLDSPLAGSVFVPIFYKETPMDRWDWDTQNDAAILWGGYFVLQRGALYRNKYIARTGDAYLLLAEAYLRKGDSGNALSTLNTLRARANATPATSIDIQVILDERARELMLEEDRWATFLRMKPEEWKPRILNYGMYTAKSGDATYPTVRRWSEYTESTIKFDNWPIPQTYIELNTEAEMEQNPGW